MKQPDTTTPAESVTEQASPPPRQLQHDTGPTGGRPCSRCGLVFSRNTAYVPCFLEGDTLTTWLARLPKELLSDLGLERLIKRSSLGTPEATALRAQADPAVVDAVLKRADELERSPVCLDCGHPLTEADHHAPVCPYCGVA